MINIRLKSNSLHATVVPRFISVSNQGGNNQFKWMLLVNPTISGPALTWTDVPNSAVQYSTGSATTLITDEGSKILSGYVTATADQADIPFDGNLALGSDQTNTSDILTLAIYNFGVNTTLAGSLGWQETV